MQFFSTHQFIQSENVPSYKFYNWYHGIYTSEIVA